jgi:hypothetical protein
MYHPLMHITAGSSVKDRERSYRRTTVDGRFTVGIMVEKYS